MLNSDIDMVTLFLSSPLMVYFNFLSCGKCFFSNTIWRGKSEFILNAEMINEDTLISAPLPKNLKLQQLT